MVIFNECRIDKEGKNLIVDIKIDELSYYNNIYLESIAIDTDKTFIENGPSSKAKTFGLLEEGGEEATGPRSKRIKFTASDLELDNLNNNLFFVYVIVGGVLDFSVPCGMDNRISMAVAVNLSSIYNTSMLYIKELEDTCNPSKNFIDAILRLKAFELSLKTGNYSTAIQQWEKFFKGKLLILPTKNCNCNGFY